MKTSRVPIITVLTCTYDRAWAIPRLYESLLKQESVLFEWVVVDDGSRDDTGCLINKLKQESGFQIRYVYQKNSGKHIAFNRGVSMARGDFVVPLDSDDELLPGSLGKLFASWHNISAKKKADCAGVLGRCVTANGELFGDKFAEDYFIGDLRRLRLKDKIKGDFSGFLRADVLKEFPFPECGVGRISFFPERIVFFRIAKKYNILFLKAGIMTYNHDSPQEQLTSLPMSRKYEAHRLHAKHMLNENLDCFFMNPKFFVREAAYFTRVSLHLKIPTTMTLKGVNGFKARCLVFMSYPIGVILFLLDRKRAGCFVRHS
ncbi:glycosyltransferase family 2 protein [Salinisphaera sp. P385]|uniref:Glycosyltransferase family 2 protein n=1 Tax=Spectribacter acetivorans TaxID=3075603 RepID=A0ABU3BDE6_9GAMM|nr:glycosyltransferase family 2 protein [Salinisphaera sp. P385]MDT0619877.1 glycosyltransferase family 2 protein [Salinisphaera sp. P385]